MIAEARALAERIAQLLEQIRDELAALRGDVQALRDARRSEHVG